jgi:hypothetical protein
MLPIVDSVLGIVNKFIPDKETQDKIALEITKEETKLAAMQKELIANEQKSESWLVRNWRPMMMVLCMTIIGTHWVLYNVIPYFVTLLGINVWTLQDPGLSGELWTTIRMGLGGYIGARSAEKIVKILKR